MWPNISKAHQYKMDSGDILINFFQNSFYIKPILMFPSSQNPTILFLMEGIFIFKTQVYQKLEVRFPLYEHSFHFFYLL
jgi:hypothetical protein